MPNVRKLFMKMECTHSDEMFDLFFIQKFHDNLFVLLNITDIFIPSVSLFFKFMEVGAVTSYVAF